ncbi:MAG: type II secretion system protein [Acidobacteria bacterium]|nr:type II secretion system protein [Acidobacteriota bacterium]
MKKTFSSTNKQRGFSMIELLVVIVIIFILSSIAIVNLLSAKTSANEAAAIGELKAFLIANHTYFTIHNSFATPAQLNKAGFIGDEAGSQETLSCGKTIFSKSGYSFTMVPTKVERRLTKQTASTPKKDDFSRTASNNNKDSYSNAPNNGNNGNNGNNDSGEEIAILEYLMDAVPLSEYKPNVFKTGIRWFYTDSISNSIWIINDPKRKNPCSPGEFCYDLTKSQPLYNECSPIN